MEREIVLSSFTVKNEGNNTPSDFTTRFTRPIILDNNMKHFISMNRIVSMSFSWYNINSEYNNQLIKYSSDNGSTFNNISFSGGVWSYIEINDYIKEVTKTGSGDNITYPITLSFDETIFRVIIVIKNNYELDLRTSEFNELIGFNKVLLKSGTHVGTFLPNLSSNTEILNIHCDIVNDSLVDGSESDIIYSFSTSVLIPSYSFEREPRRLTFNPVNKTTISSIRIYITDGLRRIINLNNADTSFSLILKSIE